MKWKTEYSLSEFIPSAIQDGYVWLDAAIRIGSESGRWQVSAIGKNLTDEYVVVGAGATAQTGGNTGTDAAYAADYTGNFLKPRTFELELSYQL
jgi:outer membrane receptor protein involved in Fe transport